MPFDVSCSAYVCILRRTRVLRWCVDEGLSSRGAQCCLDLACAWCSPASFSASTRTLLCHDSTTSPITNWKMSTRYHWPALSQAYCSIHLSYIKQHHVSVD